MKTLAYRDERVTIPVPPPPPASEGKILAMSLRQLAADIEAERVPAWQARTLMSVLGVRS